MADFPGDGIAELIQVSFGPDLKWIEPIVSSPSGRAFYLLAHRGAYPSRLTLDFFVQLIQVIEVPLNVLVALLPEDVP